MGPLSNNPRTNRHTHRSIGRAHTGTTWIALPSIFTLGIYFSWDETCISLYSFSIHTYIISIVLSYCFCDMSDKIALIVDFRRLFNLCDVLNRAGLQSCHGKRFVFWFWHESFSSGLIICILKLKKWAYKGINMLQGSQLERLFERRGSCVLEKTDRNNQHLCGVKLGASLPETPLPLMVRHFPTHATVTVNNWTHTQLILPENIEMRQALLLYSCILSMSPCGHFPQGHYNMFLSPSPPTRSVCLMKWSSGIVTGN